MVHDSMRNLQVDRRLLARRGWISPEELAEQLAALPDVSAKAEPISSPAGTDGDPERR